MENSIFSIITSISLWKKATHTRVFNFWPDSLARTTEIRGELVNVCGIDCCWGLMPPRIVAVAPAIYIWMNLCVSVASLFSKMCVFVGAVCVWPSTYECFCHLCNNMKTGHWAASGGHYNARVVLCICSRKKSITAETSVCDDGEREIACKNRGIHNYQIVSKG